MPKTRPATTPRFAYQYDAVQTIVTSQAQDDPGLFENQIHYQITDPRHLPFVGAGAISDWHLELPPDNEIDVSSASDVLIHLLYTSLDGEPDFNQAAITSLAASHPVRLARPRHRPSRQRYRSSPRRRLERRARAPAASGPPARRVQFSPNRSRALHAGRRGRGLARPGALPPLGDGKRSRDLAVRRRIEDRHQSIRARRIRGGQGGILRQHSIIFAFGGGIEELLNQRSEPVGA
jgi:hypothetical protein